MAFPSIEGRAKRRGRSSLTVVRVKSGGYGQRGNCPSNRWREQGARRPRHKRTLFQSIKCAVKTRKIQLYKPRSVNAARTIARHRNGATERAERSKRAVSRRAIACTQSNGHMRLRAADCETSNIVHHDDRGNWPMRGDVVHVMRRGFKRTRYTKLGTIEARHACRVYLDRP